MTCPSMIPTIPAPTPSNAELVASRAPAVLCCPAPASTPRGCAARVRPEVGPLVDVSALTPWALEQVRALAMAREPLIWVEASSDTPPDLFARVERFCQLYEAQKGEPFQQ
jgi:hypothetical protein